MKGYCGTHDGLHERWSGCHDWRADAKLLPPPNQKLIPNEAWDEAQGAYTIGDLIEWLRQRVAFLERELASAEDRYLKLDQIYNKLADQWSVFQATTRPDNRNIQRAEGAGEMARKLAEVLLSAAYGTDARSLLRKLLADMEPESGRTVEVGGKLVTTHRVK